MPFTDLDSEKQLGCICKIFFLESLCSCSVLRAGSVSDLTPVQLICVYVYVYLLTSKIFYVVILWNNTLVQRLGLINTLLLSPPVEGLGVFKSTPHF